MNSSIDDHADKYNDPRAKLTGRGILIGLGVVVLGIFGSALSIWARRTHLEQTTEFWGPDVILAFQLAEEFELLVDPNETGSEPKAVRLSGMPGLGHLRHVLLDDRSYDWDSVREDPITAGRSASDLMTLRLRDPSAKRFPDTKILVDVNSGWIGKDGEGQQIRFNERFRKAVPIYLKQIADYEPIRAEMREEKASGG